jgi:capsular polysaccharide transport system permease protein
MLKPNDPSFRSASLPFRAAPAAPPGSPSRIAQPDAVPPRRRLSPLRLSALVAIALPTLFAALYYGLIASDQYAVEVRFAVRGGSGQASTDVLGLVTGVPSAGSIVTDAYIVMDFIHSREILDKIEGRTDMRAIYARGDFLASFDPSETVERLLVYWKRMVSVHFDTTSQVIAVEVRAFRAEDARLLASLIVELSEDLTNQLSARARQDAVRFAEQEVKRTEDRLRANRLALQTFRETRQELDPTKTAEAQLSLLGKLEEELSSAKTKRAGLRQFMEDSAPSIRVLDSRIKAMEAQVAEERAKIGRSAVETGPSSLTVRMADYEELTVEREFAEKVYVSALASLERARLDAAQQQRYLATFVPPSLPQEALYPERILNVFLVLGAAAVLWALGVLIVYGIRDHSL